MTYRVEVTEVYRVQVEADSYEEAEIQAEKFLDYSEKQLVDSNMTIEEV